MGIQASNVPDLPLARVGSVSQRHGQGAMSQMPIRYGAAIGAVVEADVVETLSRTP